MGILSKLGSIFKRKRQVEKSEDEMIDVVAETNKVLDCITGKNQVEEDMAKKLVDQATKNGVSMYDLVDKGSNLSNAEIVNIAVRNQPELILELDDMPKYQDLITAESFIEAFVKNPSVILTNCKALKSVVEVVGKNADGTEQKQESTLRAQCLKAINMYYRPELREENGFNSFALNIVNRIEKNSFDKNLHSKRMLTRSTTIANESIKHDVSRSKYLPADALKLNNNKVLFLVPRVAKRTQKKGDYDLYRMIVCDYLKNPALSSFEDKTRVKLAKRCVEIWPELYFDLKNIPGMEVAAKSLTVQLSAYTTFKTRHNEEQQQRLLNEIGEGQSKKVVAKNKANETRKTNKKLELELKK